MFEKFYCIYVDIKLNVIEKKCLSIGTINKSVVFLREIFRYAFKYNAYGFFLAHNHPSGDSTPSKEDIYLTEEINSLCLELKIKLIDHIVVGRNNYNCIDF